MTNPVPMKTAVMPIAEELTKLCKDFKDLTVEYRDVEEAQKERSKKLEEIGARIIHLADMSDIKPPFHMDGGGRISIKHDISVKQEDKDKLCHSLEALGMQDLIQMTINTNSLRAAVKERLDKHESIPDGVSVTPYAKAVFTAS